MAVATAVAVESVGFHQDFAVAQQNDPPRDDDNGIRLGGRPDGRHRDALGEPCLSVRPIAKPQVVNPNIYDQMLVILNRCNRPIKIRACYVGSDRCIGKEIPALARVELILGISPMLKYFRYDLKEVE